MCFLAEPTKGHKMTYQNTEEAREYKRLKDIADHYEMLTNKYPGNSDYFHSFVEAELEVSYYAYENEELIFQPTEGA